MSSSMTRRPRPDDIGGDPTHDWSRSRLLPGWVRTTSAPALGGAALLLVVVLVVLLSAPFAVPDPQAWGRLGLVLAVPVVVALAAVRLPTQHLHRSWSLIFPAGAMATLWAVELVVGGVVTIYLGIVPLAFLYTGLFHQPPVGLLLLPLAWAVDLTAVGGTTSDTGVRLVVHGVVWTTLSVAVSLLTSRQRTISRRLHELARTDPLTSLGNRRGLDERLARLQPGDSVVVCDLDRFKDLNDRHGHAAGDHALELFGAAVGGHLRRRDYAARYGGEEFVILLPRTSTADAVAVVHAVRDDWRTLSPLLTFSAGIAAVGDGCSPAQVLAAADAALYAAKQAGRDRVHVAGPP